MKIKEPLKEITLFDTPETDEAKYLLKKRRIRFRYQLIISFFAFVIGCTLLSIITTPPYPADGFLIIVIVICYSAVPICISVYIVNIKAYKQLLKIAKHNDSIRNDEHLRFKERLRLENELKKQKITIPKKPNKTDVKEIDKTINEIFEKHKY